MTTLRRLPDLGGPAPHPLDAGEAPTTLPTDPHPAISTAAPTARLAGGGAIAVITKMVIPAGKPTGLTGKCAAVKLFQGQDSKSG